MNVRGQPYGGIGVKADFGDFQTCFILAQPWVYTCIELHMQLILL